MWVEGWIRREIFWDIHTAGVHQYRTAGNKEEQKGAPVQVSHRNSDDFPYVCMYTSVSLNINVNTI